MYKLVSIQKTYLEKEENELVPKVEYTVEYTVNETRCLLIFKTFNNVLTKHIKLCNDEHDLVKLCQKENIDWEQIRGNND